MARLVTYLGPKPRHAFAGMSLVRGEPVLLPPDLAERLAAYPCFSVEPDEPAPAPEPAPRKRGRPRKGDA